jgi:MoxR-like ATPase
MNTIEFRCPQCDKLLRVGAAFAGKDAKCPQCGTVSKIPMAAGSTETGAAPSPSPTAGPQPPAEPVPTQQTGVPLPAPLTRQTQPAPAAGPASAKPPSSDKPHPNRLSTGGLTEGFAGPSPTRELFERIITQLRKIYVGQDELVLGTLVALFSGGHVLIESYPGLGKTLFVRTLGKVLGCRFGRIQFTADLMPSDITGSPIFDMKEQEFRFRPGPVFTQLLLADEINRSPAKTHAALLEIMQEYHVTVDGKTHVLERPFLVMATQNPIESEGTYNLPEAQVDRFMLKLTLDYPAEGEEAEILKMHSQQIAIDDRLEREVETVTSPGEILETTRRCGEVRIDDRLVDYINKLVRLSRQWPQFHLGGSPRAGLALMQGARTLAAFRGRDYAVPDDVVELVLPALRHRVILTAEAEVEGRHVDELLTEMVRTVEVPRL